jgi:hypothetical protein
MITPLRDQGGYHFVSGVRVYAELLAEHSHRREGIAGRELATDNRLLDREKYLLRDRQAGLQVDREREHTVLCDIVRIGTASPFAHRWHPAALSSGRASPLTVLEFSGPQYPVSKGDYPHETLRFLPAPRHAHWLARTDCSSSASWSCSTAGTCSRPCRTLRINPCAAREAASCFRRTRSMSPRPAILSRPMRWSRPVPDIQDTPQPIRPDSITQPIEPPQPDNHLVDTT